jgi:hypothetical protein
MVHAQLNLCDEVRLVDAVVAIWLFEESLVLPFSVWRV